MPNQRGLLYLGLAKKANLKGAGLGKRMVKRENSWILLSHGTAASLRHTTFDEVIVNSSRETRPDAHHAALVPQRSRPSEQQTQFWVPTGRHRGTCTASGHIHQVF